MFRNLMILAEETSEAPAGNSSWVLLLVVGGMLVLMFVLTYLPQRKRKKQFQDMQASLKVGDKIMTIGRLIGTVEAINDDNTILVNCGTAEAPTIIKIDKDAIGVNMSYTPPAPQAKGAPKTENKDDQQVSLEENMTNVSFEGDTNDLSLDKNDEEANVEEKKSGSDDFI